MTDPATERQNFSARPDQSTWLSANAGSGKTRVLTNRVARLLLHGVEPQNILCLTYTKAAASEMQNRLFKTLGSWAMLEDGALREELSKLGERPMNDLSRARTLFASAIEAPGGLKIQTIHSLCSSILRQFPLEAGVHPQFKEVDETQQAILVEEVLNDLALQGSSALQGVTRYCQEDTLATLALDVSRNAEKFARRRSRAEIFESFGLRPECTTEEIAAEAIGHSDIAFLKGLIPILRQSDKTTDISLADQFERMTDHPSVPVLLMLEKEFLLKKEPFKAKLSSLPTKNVRKAPEFAPQLSEFQTIMTSVERAREVRTRLFAAEQSWAIDRFATEFLPAYRSAKSKVGALDFDDLIRYTRTLLTSRSMQWVMYRLDGRIDHILVDEAQDTSPTQWDVIEALAEEITSSESDTSRTLFVVGDKKQSIYSFQGADAAGFDRRAESFRRRLAGGQGLCSAELEHSFRSSSAILSAVDHVFDGDPGFTARHLAFHQDMPGRVDLWPLIPKPETENDLAWYDTSDRRIENSAAHTLANRVADQIKDLIEKETIQGENGPRPIKAGDIMVLVQRRSALFDEIIRACKKLELEIAGADRLKVGSELAVRDLLALLSFLDLPDDSLSLAAALRSPLFGWTEQDLYKLAANREPELVLWAALRQRKEEFPDTYQQLSALLDQVNYLRPYELLERILTHHGGRVRFLERLGVEAEDGINELLAQALNYERGDVPSLTGFLNMATSTDIDIKRQSDSTGGLIRVMTVHAAKGLESPVVILPDTTFGDPRSDNNLLDADGHPVFPIRREDAPPSVSAAKSARKTASREERNRLLYVAMTRAEKWLIVCGVAPPKNAAKDIVNWHKMVESGLKRSEALPLDTPVGKGLRLSKGAWPSTASEPFLETVSAKTKPLPAYNDAPNPRPSKPVVSPSDLGGAKVIGGGANEEFAAKQRGRQIHLLLEHLPGAKDSLELAQMLLSAGPDRADPEEIPVLLEEASATISKHPWLFEPGALAEVSLVADLPELGARVSGTVDRLLVSDAQVLAIDFKTNAIVPTSPEQTPEGLLRQMGAYLVALEQIYPDHDIQIAILWTATGELMTLEHGIVRDALQRTPTS